MNKTWRSRIQICAWAEFCQWLRNPRMILAAVLLVYMHFIVVGPMFNAAESLETYLGVFEPFLAICSDDLIMLLFPIFFVVLMADYPRIGIDTTFRVYRIGRRNWMVGQVGMLMLSSLVYVGGIFLACVGISLLQGGVVTLSWSGAVTYASSHVIQQGRMVNFLPPNIYFQLTQPQALGYSLLVLWLNCILMGAILMTATLCGIRKAGPILATGSIAIGMALMKLDAGVQWLFPTSHFVLKEHFTAYFSTPNMPVPLSMLYDLGLAMALFAVCYWKVSSYHFISNGED